MRRDISGDGLFKKGNCMNSKWMRLVFLALFASFLAARTASPVTTTGTILGTVMDPSGGAVPGAEVVIINANTGELRSYTTDSSGGYEVPELKPGTYTIRAKAPGFKTKEITSIVLQVDQKARVDVPLEVGAVTETVEVIGAAPLVNTESASMGTVITNRRVVSLPLNGRSFVTLAQLVPGANPGNGTINWEGVGLSINGQRGEDNNYMLDGVDNNVQTIGSQSLTISIDAVEEFKVQASSYAAEFGRAGGSQISIATKSGTNQLHGTLFEFHRDNNLQARNFFDAAKPGHYVQNQFGGSIGGPVVIPKVYNGRQRTFFFFNIDRVPYRQANPIRAYVPPAAFREGDFSSLSTPIINPFTGEPFDGNMIPSTMINPISQKALVLWPEPNSGDPFAPPNLFVAASRETNDHQWTARVDHQLRSSDSLFVRFSLRNQRGFGGSFSPLAGGSGSENPVRNLAINETHIFSPRVLNEFRAGLNRRQTNTITQNPGHNYAADLGLPVITDRPGDWGYPGLNVPPYNSAGDGGNDPRPS